MPNVTLAPSARWEALDFWRGYLLCTIFINHVPGNAFEALTQKNFGFSDSAEGFVFLSGVSLALAYARRVADSEWKGVTQSLMRRAAKLYGLHVFLSLFGLAIFLAGAAFLDGASLLQNHGRDLAIDAPGTMVIGVLSLGHQFGYFNILPMYILMIVIAPVLLWMGRKSSVPMIVASFLVYFLAITQGWNLPSWPEKGFWFFNPLAWQFLMSLGIAVGLAARRAPLARSVPLCWLAAVVVTFGLLSVTNGFSFVPGFEDWTRSWADIDKTTLGLGRLLHFFCVAYLVYALRLADWFRSLPIYRPLCTVGRNSLSMFALLSLMAAIGQVLVQRIGHTLMTDVVMMAAGLGVLVGIAYRLDAQRFGKPRTPADDLPEAKVEPERRSLPLGSKLRLAFSPK